MNNISLTQLTAFVIAVCLASFFVNAGENLVQTAEENTVVYVDELANPEVTQEIEYIEETNDMFTFTSLDSDQNGKLNKQEVVAGKNDWLAKAFNDIDSNSDKSITEQELVDFATNMATTITAME